MITSLCLMLLNAVLLNLVIIGSFYLKFGGDVPEANFSSYKETYHFLTLTYIFAFSYAGAFRGRFRSYWDLFRRIVTGLFLGTFFGISFIYVFRLKWASFPSSIFLLASVLGVFVIFMADALLLRVFGKIKKRVVIIGKEKNADGLQISPIVEYHHLEKIEDIMRLKDIDEIVICQHFPGEKQLNTLLFLLLKLRVSVLFSPGLYADLISKNILEENSIKFLATFIGRRSDTEEFLIRALDVVGSVVLGILLCPLFIIISILIRVTSSCTVLYKQSRIAKDGNPFTLLKFRTMVGDAEKHTGPVLATMNDPRITKIGSFLRKTRLDELPQLWNVFWGQMSLVGPRPERPHFVRRHKAIREIRLAVKPGITGLAQIRSVYGLAPERKIKYDYLYIQKRSLVLNVYILMKTVGVVLSRKGR